MTVSENSRRYIIEFTLAQRTGYHPFRSTALSGRKWHLIWLLVRKSMINGIYGLNRNGPMRGEPVKLSWLMVSNNILAADVAALWG